MRVLPEGVVEARPPAADLFDSAMELATSLKSKGKDEKTRDLWPTAEHVCGMWTCLRLDSEFYESSLHVGGLQLAFKQRSPLIN